MIVENGSMGSVTADVQIEDQSTLKVTGTPKKSGDSIYHARQGCGFFWALGKFRPTNYMIVSHTIQSNWEN
jgi:hypothetical protein